MCFVNNAAGYAAGTTTAMTTDDTLPGSGAVTTVIPLGYQVWAKNTTKASQPIELLGQCTAVSATSVRIGGGGGTKFALVDNQELYVIDPAGLALTLAIGYGFTLADPGTAALEISNDGRGMMVWCFYDWS
jgi:hypothetical protein